MAVTPNYSWPVPVATDLVKDGYQAIADLGDAIDATVFGLPGSGLTLIGTTTFTSVASISLAASTFTATYDNYKLIYSNVNIATSAQNVFVRLRNAGADLTTTTYNYGGTSTTTTATTVAAISSNSAGDAEIFVGNLALTNKHSIEIELYNPFNSALKSFFIRSTFDGFGAQVSGYNTTATSFDSLTFYPAANNITGKVSVYGYNK